MTVLSRKLSSAGSLSTSMSTFFGLGFFVSIGTSLSSCQRPVKIVILEEVTSTLESVGRAKKMTPVYWWQKCLFCH